MIVIIRKTVNFWMFYTINISNKKYIYTASPREPGF